MSNPKYANILTREFLERKYCGEERTIQDIANEVGISYSVVRTYLIRSGIQLRSRSEAAILWRGVRKKLPKNKLEELYINRDWSVPMIAKEFGVSDAGVGFLLKEYGISIRSARESALLAHGKGRGSRGGGCPMQHLDHLTKDKLWEMYVKREMTARQVAEELDVGRRTIYKYLRHHDIPIRKERGEVFKSGPEHSMWKGSRIESEGYIRVHAPEHDGADAQGRILEHILVWERNYGEIPDGWHVHHINGVKTDNRIENLMALPSKKHMLVIPMLKSRIRNLEREVGHLRSGHNGNLPFVGEIEFYAFDKLCILAMDGNEIFCPHQEWISNRIKEVYGDCVKVEFGPGRIIKKRKHLTIGLSNSADPYCDIYIDLNLGLRFLEDGLVDEIFSNQFLEHLSRKRTIFFFNEMWRVLKPGGKMEHCVPHYLSPWADGDPTHFNRFSQESFRYFCARDDDTPFVDRFSDYGIKCAFILEKQVVRHNLDIRVWMSKP